MSENKHNVVVELSDVISGLRNELTIAQEKAKGQKLKLVINHIDVELEVSIMKKCKGTIGAEAGLNTEEGLLKYVLGKFDGKIKLGGEIEYEKVAKQKVTINLSAKGKQGRRATVSKIDKKE